MTSLKSFRNHAKSSTKNFARKLRNNTTRSEKILWENLRNKKLGVRFRRQVIILNYIVDFCCPSEKLVVELDGKYHYRPGQQEIDKYRDEQISDQGYRILRIDSSRVFTDLTAVIAEIYQNL